jgi:hypothetical protein
MKYLKKVQALDRRFCPEETATPFGAFGEVNHEIDNFIKVLAKQTVKTRSTYSPTHPVASYSWDQ